MTLLFVIDLDPENPVSDEDIEAIMQPDTHELVCRVTDPHDANMEALAARAGVFPSRGQARKNGFSGSVPHGLEMFGAGGCSFFAWNPVEPATKPTIGKKRKLWKHWTAFLDTMRATGARGSWSEPVMMTAFIEWEHRRQEGTWGVPF